MRRAAALLLLAAPTSARETLSLKPCGASPPASVADLAWLEDSWEGPGLGAPATETYPAPANGQMAGHFAQLSPDGGVQFNELMQVVPRGRSLVYRLRHFGADLNGWEDAKDGRAVEFPLVALTPGRTDFDGLSLRREGPDGFTAWVRVADGAAPREIAFRYRRAASPRSSTAIDPAARPAGMAANSSPVPR